MKNIPLELGSGGQMMRNFIRDKILATFRNQFLEGLNDSAVLPGKIAFTTDSYVIDPLFFPGSDIGQLAINGTVNDLVVSGARPLYISLSFIIEEGLEETIIDQVLKSARLAAERARVKVVTGDLKVVRRGQADKMYINTSGIGQVISRPSPERIKGGDKVILTGPVGDHSIAVMGARGELPVKTRAKSDCAPLIHLLLLWKKGAFWMRDITRGGLATVLSELASGLRYSIVIEESKIPRSKAVQGASDILGIDPLFLACEGQAVIIAPGIRAEQFLVTLKKSPLSRKASIIGEVKNNIGQPGELLLRTSAGGLRLLEPLTTELLPRIC